LFKKKKTPEGEPKQTKKPTPAPQKSKTHYQVLNTSNMEMVLSKSAEEPVLLAFFVVG